MGYSFGISHGTLGELFQGPFFFNNQLPISIISLPIQKYSWVTLTNDIHNGGICKLKGKIKCKKAVELFLRFFQERPPKGQWSFYSELEEGKGMASSTADIVATLRCLQMYYQRKIELQTVLKILSEIERSDSMFINSFSLYLSGKQKITALFKLKPKLYAIYIDENYNVNTEDVGDNLLNYYKKNFNEFSMVLNDRVELFRTNHINKICVCSTQSALLSQKIFPKKSFQLMLSRKEKFKADGLVAAHTGSLIGYLLINPL